MTKEEEKIFAGTLKRLYPELKPKERYNIGVKYLEKILPEDVLTEDNEITNQMVDE